ncbi:IclR family transcriptional regulator domain-containing protein [Agrobacterium tumefaciens]
MCLTGRAPISIQYEPGDAIALHSTAIGKCILASFSDEEVLEIIGSGPLPAVTDKTITDQLRLFEDVLKSRERGFAIVQDENIEGIVSVGALIRQTATVSLTAISLSFPPYFSKAIDLDEAAAVITAAAKRISRVVAP